MFCIAPAAFIIRNTCTASCADPEGGGGSGPPPPWNFGKNEVIRFVNGAGLILHRIYVEYNPD